MPRIKGIITELLNKGECYLRVKPSSPWIGVSTGIQSFKVKNGKIDINLDPSPNDRVWLVDYITGENALTERFTPRESWCVPVEDCDISEIRNFSPTKVKELKELVLSLKQEQELQSAYTKNLEIRLEHLVSENNKLTIDTDYVQNLEIQLFNLQKDYEINLTKLNNIKLLQEQIETLTTENSRLAQSAVEEEGLDTKVNSSFDILKRFS